MEARLKNPVMLIPGALQALLALDKSTEAADLPYVTRKLVHLRASQINGCSVCVDMHARELKKPARRTNASLPCRPGGKRRTSPMPNAPRLPLPRPAQGWPTERMQ